MKTKKRESEETREEPKGDEKEDAGENAIYPMDTVLLIPGFYE